MSSVNLFTEYQTQIQGLLLQTYPLLEESIKAVVVELPKQAAHGHLATNAAMVLAGSAKQAPKDLAQDIIQVLKSVEDFESMEVAGPGFINITLKHQVWQKLLRSIKENPKAYGNSSIGAGKSVNIEFVSANPTGPMHIGHVRGAIVGDVLANVLQKCAFNVTREYYINDAGGQINVLASSVYTRYQQLYGMDVQIQPGCYPGEYLIPVAEALKDKYQDALLNKPQAEWKGFIEQFATDEIMKIIKDDLKSLGVTHDMFRSEKHDIIGQKKLEVAFAKLKAQDLIYQGVLEQPKGKTIEDWEAKEQMLFRSTLFGDDMDRTVQKSDGAHTYFAGDIAYHLDKIERKFDHLILLLGADHAGHIKRLKAAVKALSNNAVDIDIIINQMVNVMENGEAIKMSKRRGQFITAKDMLDMLGKNILRFVMLYRKADTVLDLDIAKALEQSKDNPVFYVQYAHTRVKSVMRKAEGIDFASPDLSLLASCEEIALIQKIAEFPKVIESIAVTAEPHRLPYYLYQLASLFHSFWSLGNSNEEMRFIIEDKPEISKARLYMLDVLANVIRNGLELMGIEALNEM